VNHYLVYRGKRGGLDCNLVGDEAGGEGKINHCVKPGKGVYQPARVNF